MSLWVCVECPGSCLFESPGRPDGCKYPKGTINCEQSPVWHFFPVFPDNYVPLQTWLTKQGYVMLSPEDVKKAREKRELLVGMLSTFPEGI